MFDITFVVPCYNSAGYMRRCIDSLLVSDHNIEIIIVNDGSTDGTGAIADEYAQKHQDFVRVIHQENGGHGSGVNAGLRAARGRYFKVVDSDDWLDSDNLVRLLDQLKKWREADRLVDMVVCNYIYDQEYCGKQKRISYGNVFAEGKITNWRASGRFYPSQYLIMHAVVFRTEILREAKVQLPRHTFYVDNLFVCWPLSYVQSICYLDLDLYHYLIGREGQSVNVEIQMKRIDQQLLVTRMIIDYCNEIISDYTVPEKCVRYVIRFTSMMITISSIYLLKIGTMEALGKRTEMWRYVKARNPWLYRRLRGTTLSGLSSLPGKAGGKVVVFGYQLAQNIYGFTAQ